MVIRNSKFYYTFAVIISLSLMIGCGSCDAEKKDDSLSKQNLSKQITYSTIFKIIISNGGGFTGLKNGYSLFSFGRIDKWQQLSFAKDTILWTVNIDSSQIYTLKDEIENSGILNENLNESGNMTSNLKYETKDSTYAWSWSGNNDDAEDSQNEIKNIYSKIKTFCSELKNNN